MNIIGHYKYGIGPSSIGTNKVPEMPLEEIQKRIFVFKRNNSFVMPSEAKEFQLESLESKNLISFI